MKKKLSKKLTLCKETLKVLEGQGLQAANGGEQSAVCESGYPCISWIIECAIDSNPPCM
jgi:hypothetical protein